MGPDGQAAQRIRRRKHALSAIALVVLLAIVPGPPKAQEITLTQVRVRNDQNQPVYSEIVQIPPTVPEKSLPLDETDDQGVLNLSFVCPQGTRIQARPYSKAYTYSKKAYCRPTLELRVDPINVMVRLQANLDKALEAEDYATAMLIANELANIETREGKGVTGRAAENFAIVYAEKAFGVINGVFFDRVQGMAVMAPELQAEVRKYQRLMGLNQTGQLDYKTVSTLAGTSSGAVRYTAYGANPM